MLWAPLLGKPAELSPLALRHACISTTASEWRRGGGGGFSFGRSWQGRTCDPILSEYYLFSVTLLLQAVLVLHL